MITVELVTDGSELPLLELGRPDATPSLGCTDEGGMHQLQHGTLAEGMWDHLAAGPEANGMAIDQWADLALRLTNHQ